MRRLVVTAFVPAFPGLHRGDASRRRCCTDDQACALLLAVSSWSGGRVWLGRARATTAYIAVGHARVHTRETDEGGSVLVATAWYLLSVGPGLTGMCVSNSCCLADSRPWLSSWPGLA